jgi:hypothetical protein
MSIVAKIQQAVLESKAAKKAAFDIMKASGTVTQVVEDWDKPEWEKWNKLVALYPSTRRLMDGADIAPAAAAAIEDVLTD